MNTIQVIGDLILDQYISGTARRLSPEAPVPVLTSMETTYVAGGAANVARNLASLGCRVELYGAVGEQEETRTLCEMLQADQIEIRVISNATAKTTVKTRIVADGQQLVRLDAESSHRDLSPDITAALADTGGADIVVFSDYNKGVLDQSRELIRKIKHSRVLVDPKRPLDNYAGAWLVKPNRKEFEQFFGEFDSVEDIIRLARRAMDTHSISNVLVTLGAEGMLLVTDKSYRGYESTAQEVFDITGAGDVVLAVLAYSLSHGIDLEAAVGMASRAAGISVAHKGNYIVQPSDIQQFGTVFTNGCFDILHEGHVRYLKQSRELGNRLVVGINSDASVTRLKGPGRPVNNQDARKAVLEALGCVDEVIVFDEDTPLELIMKIRPDVITKGGDYRAEQVVGANIAKAVIILPYHSGTSTTETIARIKNAS